MKEQPIVWPVVKCCCLGIAGVDDTKSSVASPIKFDTIISMHVAFQVFINIGF